MYSEAEIQWNFGMHESDFTDIPLMDMFGIYSDPLYASLDILPTQNTLMQGNYRSFFLVSFIKVVFLLCKKDFLLI